MIKKSHITQRLSHTGKRINEGYCVICGEFGKLYIDHVPPQGSINVTRVEQHHVMEVFGGRSIKKPKGAISANGSKFKTLCRKCNSDRLGGFDGEIKNVYHSLANQVSSYFLTGVNPFPKAATQLHTEKFLRAMIGHVLSATTATECLMPQESSIYFDPLKNFVINGGNDIENTHRFFCWFYPYERHLSAKLVSWKDDAGTSLVSLLAFYPLAFLIASKECAVAPAHSTEIKLSDSILSVTLSLKNLDYATFPFVPLKGNNMMLLTDHLCITSSPLRNE
ncbi:MAG: metal-binding protein [Pseudomonadota bacterium]